MSIAMALATYFVIWWIVLFAVLPWGVQTQEESGHVVPGSAESAPSSPHLLAKAAATTLVSLLIFALVYWLVVYKPVSLNDIPVLPRFER